MEGFATSDMLMLIGLLVMAGLAAGLIAGLLGIGGGIVTVPALFHLFTVLGVDPSVSMHTAVGTSLATIVVTAISSIRAHAGRGGLDAGLLWRWGPFVILGAGIGALISTRATGQALAAIFGVVALSAAVNMALRSEGTRWSERMPSLPVQAAIAGLIGTVSVLMGIGGGTLSVPAQTLFGVPIRRAVGTSAALGLIIAVAGSLGFIWAGWDVPLRLPFSLGFVSLIGFVLIAPLTILTAPVGAHLAHKLPPRWLRGAFALFLAVTAVRMLNSAFAP